MCRLWANRYGTRIPPHSSSAAPCAASGPIDTELVSRLTVRHLRLVPPLLRRPLLSRFDMSHTHRSLLGPIDIGANMSHTRPLGSRALPWMGWVALTAPLQGPSLAAAVPQLLMYGPKLWAPGPPPCRAPRWPQPWVRTLTVAVPRARAPGSHVMTSTTIGGYPASQRRTTCAGPRAAWRLRHVV